MAEENPLWDLIQSYMDDPKHRYPPKPADLARETGVSEQVLSKWKAKPVLPEAGFLLTFAYGTGIPYESLLRAALVGKTYLPSGTVLQMPQGYENWFRDSRSNVRRMERFIATRNAANELSEPSDTTERLRAADNRETSISGEQAEPDLP